MNCLIERVPLTDELKRELLDKKLHNGILEGGSVNKQILTGKKHPIFPLDIEAPGFVHVARLNGELIGWCFLINCGFHRNLLSTYVNKEFRLQGIGKQLVIHTSRDSQDKYVCSIGKGKFYEKVKPHTEKQLTIIM